MARRPKEKVEEVAIPSILQRLVEEQQKRSLEDEFTADVAVLFCGGKQSGKTSLVDRFINPQKDEKDVPKTTVALEYKFARYASDTSSAKILAHIYDLGENENIEGLTAIPVSTSTVGNLVIALTIDLSEPHSCVPTLERWVSLLREQVSNRLEELSRASTNGKSRVEIIANAKREQWAQHPDAQSVAPFPVPLILFCTKWDVMSAAIEPEKRKGLCRALRHFAHVNGASLIFTALKEKASMNNVRGVLRQLLFGVAAKGGIADQLDPSKPIVVMAAKDSLEAIGGPRPGPCNRDDRGWREVAGALFPEPPKSKESKSREGELLSEELLKYPESSVDGMVEQRVGELEQYRKQVERNQRLASEGVDTSKIAAMQS
jgi:dynein light intermediate chain 2